MLIDQCYLHYLSDFIFLAGTPVGIEYSDVKEKLMAIEGVTAIHDLRIWSLTLNQVVMSAHLAVGK